MEVEQELVQSKEKLKQVQGYFHQKERELKEVEEEIAGFQDEILTMKADRRILDEEQRSVAREMERLDDFRGCLTAIAED